LNAKGIKSAKPILLWKTKNAVKIFPRFKLNAYGMQPIEVIEQGNLKAEIYPDENPESPREWDNMGKMVAFHKGYSLGDKTDLKSDQFNGWNELEDYLWKKEHAKIILPIYLYDHSGLRMKVGSFSGLLPQGHAEFDSGQVGFIYATEKDIKDNFGVKKLTKTILEKAEKNLRGEVETYDQYLSGDVYGYKIVEKKPVTITKKYPDGTMKTETTVEEDETDSCWGYYGMDTVRDEVKSILKTKKQ
jgi:hypothetical protein